jgi:hypothetical protein
MRGFSAAALLAAGFFASAPGANALGVPAGAGPLPPHLSLAHAKYYDSHPAEWDALLKRLPNPATLPLPRHRQQPPPLGNTWTPLTNAPPESGVSNPLLLTDGSVIVHVGCSEHWYKLKPGAFGSYINGTWSAIASFPSGYSPLYFASQILNDGRVVASGGEYNNGSSGCQSVWQTNGAIYNPVSNAWTTLAPPSGWSNIGDAQSVILPNTRYMLANCCTAEAAILDSKTLTWTPTGSGKFDVNDEEGWALLHDGSVLTTDAYVYQGSCGKGSERYTPGTGSWASAGDATTQLSDCSGNNSYEVGPIVVRTSGAAVAFSGVTTGVAGTSIYHPSTGWSAGPDLPTLSGQNYNMADAPAVELPSNGVLFAASPGLFSSPVHFFELTPANAIVQRPDTPNAPGLSSYQVNFLMLPTGQVLQTDGSNDVEIYTPDGTYDSAWKPVISSVAPTLTRGNVYAISGTQLSGITHGVYGDDQQAATNFPLVRLTNNTTHRVRFARTRDFSSRSDKPGHASRASFVMPGASAIPAGSYTLVVIANGIPSDPVSVTVN